MTLLIGYSLNNRFIGVIPTIPTNLFLCNLIYFLLFVIIDTIYKLYIGGIFNSYYIPICIILYDYMNYLYGKIGRF